MKCQSIVPADLKHIFCLFRYNNQCEFCPTQRYLKCSFHVSNCTTRKVWPSTAKSGTNLNAENNVKLDHEKEHQFNLEHVLKSSYRTNINSAVISLIRSQSCYYIYVMDKWNVKAMGQGTSKDLWSTTNLDHSIPDPSSVIYDRFVSNYKHYFRKCNFCLLLTNKNDLKP